MDNTGLGRTFNDGELIIRESEYGDCMYVIQSGKVEVIMHRLEGKEVRIAELGEGDFFGEMAVFEKEVRSATVKAKGEVTVITVDKKTLLRRIQQDPSLAFRLLEKMSSRIRRLDTKYSRITASDRRDWENRPEKWINA
ncbi:MAG: cyclic nucleotide-binding domain-containing protein [Calditrichia bacterium]|nr:cyclic nucleotide-binding domain-containing protein [Calditrichia bacterium]